MHLHNMSRSLIIVGRQLNLNKKLFFLYVKLTKQVFTTKQMFCTIIVITLSPNLTPKYHNTDIDKKKK